MSARSRRRHRRTSKKRNPFIPVLAVLAATAMLVVLGLGIYVLSVAAEAPSIDELRPVEVGENSVVYAADGSRLGFIQSDEARTPVKSDFIPDDLKNATVAIEDERFYQHGGVDIEGVVRAAFENIEAGEVKQGGSTITMQLARNLFIEDPERDLQRKIKEAKIAEELESAHSKEWILTEYLNTASYGTFNGRTAVGVEAASQIYYSKPVRDLDLAQSAMLAGLPQSPSLYNPLLNPTSALQRRNEVLSAMEDQGYISEEESKAARAEGLKLKLGSKYDKIKEPYFFDYVEQQLIEEYGVNTVRQGGLKVHTTIDPTLQSAALDAIRGQLYYPDDPSAALVAIDPRTGFIRAMASSGTYADEQFNLAAQGHRQPGSAAKTWALTTAVRRGINPDTTFYNSHPLDIDDPIYGPWQVQTYSNSYAGNISLHDATLASDNTVYAQLALDLGPDSIADTAHDMGIETQLDGYPAETLGGLRIGVSPLEMTDAYATLASGGVRNKPIAIRKVVFPNGQVDELGEPDRTRAFPDGVAYEVTQVLKDNIIAGTGTNAYTGCGDQAGKTGTTDDFNDAMFMGFTPKLAAGVWVGYPDALRSMYSVHGIAVAGGTFPAMIWHDFMVIALQRVGCATFPEPQNPVEWVPFHGTYTSDSSTSSCEQGTTNGGGSGTSEGLYGCEPEKKKKKKKNDGKDPGAFAPGVGQKPIPKPKPKPKPPPKPDPEPEPEPPPTTTTTTPPPSGGTGT
jgi:penicillin-binding protein 1A